ncbi:MAG: hypothetical protein M3253_09255 [Chloroflexota bacterium]|nr:hypothetical protein [Chloroflexota bacterium]
MKRLSLSLLSALLLVGLMAAPAAAKPLEREHYSFSDSFDDVICGVPLHGEFNASGLFMLKEGRRGNPTPYFFDNYSWQVVWTDPADPSRGFIESGNALWRDQHITLLEGTVYRFVIREVGAPYQIRTLDGRKVLRDRGRITWTFDVDTQGDADLSNDVFLTDPTPVSVAGPHPLLFLDGDEWCDVVLSILD